MRPGIYASSAYSARNPVHTRLFAAAVLLPLLAVGIALFTQYRLDMQPCPWCVLQRLLFVLVAIAALPGLLVRQTLVRRISAGGVLVFSLCGAAAALWQHFVAASSTSCNRTLADQIVTGLGLDESMPHVFGAYASCAEAARNLVGVPYALWSLALFVVLAGAAVVILRPRR